MAELLSFLNLVFFLGQITQMYFLRKIGRSISFSLGLMRDFVLFVVSCLSIEEISSLIMDIKNYGEDEQLKVYLMMDALIHHITFRYDYMFTIQVCMLLMKIIEQI